jgi:uncharacterized OsmC-like protein
MRRDLVQHLSISLLDGYKFQVAFDDVPGAARLTVDDAKPLGGGEGPDPVSLLAAAAGTCLASSLVFCLQKTHAHVHGLTVRVAAHVATTDVGRPRLSHLEVELSPELDQQDMNRLTKCEGFFQDFCAVTESIRHGLPVKVTVKTFQEVSVTVEE